MATAPAAAPATPPLLLTVYFSAECHLSLSCMNSSYEKLFENLNQTEVEERAYVCALMWLSHYSIVIQAYSFFVFKGSNELQTVVLFKNVQ